VTRYIDDGRYEPRPTITTLSTAMDVGNPSNFARLRYFYHNDHESMAQDITGIAVSDKETIATIQSVHERFGYVMDPHTAVAFRALERFRISESHVEKPGILLSTAHPAKFLEAIESALGKEIGIPSNLQNLMEKKKSATLISSEYKELASFLNELDQ
jgi:threonine synthase